MTLADAQSVLDKMADVIIASGSSPSETDVEFYAEDGTILRIRFEWKVVESTYSAEWRNA